MWLLWPPAVLVALLGHAQATDHSECYQGAGHRDEAQPKASRTLIQVQLQRGIVELQAGNENKRDASEAGTFSTAPGAPQTRPKARRLHTANFEHKPYLKTNSAALELQARAKLQHRHTASIKLGPHLEMNNATKMLKTRTLVQHLPTTSIELKTNSTNTELNITPKSHQQHGPTAKAGTSALHWLQMLYVKSRTKIEVMVDRQGGAMQDLAEVLQYLLGVAVFICIPIMIVMACLGGEPSYPIRALMGEGGFFTNAHHFWRRRGRQVPTPQAFNFSRTGNHRRLGSPGSKSASPPSGSSVPQQQQQHKQLHSRDQSRQQHPPVPAGDRGPCICPELRVPAGKECCLLLPRIKAKDVRRQGRFTIVSPDGAAVFSLTLGSSSPTASHGERLLTLQSAATEGVVFASCDSVALDQGEPEKLAINGTDGKHYADMQTAGRKNNVVLAPLSGPSATIRYEDQGTGRIEIADSNGWLMAAAEVIDDSVQAVRICARVDAGLIAITILSFNLLEQPEQEVDN